MSPTLVLPELEQIIKECRNNEYYSSQDLRGKVVKGLLDIGKPGSEASESNLLALISDKQMIDNDKVFVATLLRILQYKSMDWLTENPWRLKIVNLVERKCEKIFDDKQLKFQAHEKVELLAEKAKDSDKAFVSAINQLTSLDRVKAATEKIMRSIKSNIGQSLIIPFFPPNIDASIAEVSKAVELYQANYSTSDVISFYDRVISSINLLCSDLSSYQNLYSELLIDGYLLQLKSLVTEHFSSSPAGKPCSVVVKHDQKKYPLSHPNKMVQVPLLVSNNGPGYANNVELFIINNDDIYIENPIIQIGNLEPGQFQPVDVYAKTQVSIDRTEIMVETKWSTFGCDNSSNCINIILESQNHNINWDDLETSDPYSLDAVLTEEDLVGRRDVLNKLIANCKNNVNSSIIKGQKRVGKTSIARALENRLISDGAIVIYLEGGDYVVPTAIGTISRLGEKLFKEVILKEPRLKHIIKPNFTDALSPIVDFLDEMQAILPDKRLIIILDEFDELPLDLYYRGPLGDSFFLTLRSISSKKNIGFVLVGGERMAQIIDCQGDQLNKWQSFEVDYFDRETKWNDYKELIHRPVANNLEFSDEAYEALHDITAGNPFFTKVICKRIYDNAVSSRDNYIGKKEVFIALNLAVIECDKNTFQHFWEDRILETGEKAAEQSIRRRKVLIAVSELIEKHKPVNIQHLMHHDLIKEVPSFEADLKEFEARNILNLKIDEYQFKVKLFELWLKARGVSDIISTFLDLDALLRIKQAEEQQKITSNEILALKKRFGMYKGQQISEDRIRAWFDQFSTPKEQRLMFKILSKTTFYSGALCRDKLRIAHSIVKSNVIHVLEDGKMKRSDIIVSYHDHVSKSGAAYAKMYADEVNIYVDNVIEKGSLDKTLSSRSDIQALVFIDDIIGTGSSALEYMTDVDKIIYPHIVDKNINVFFIAIAGFKDGIKKIQDSLPSFHSEIKFHVVDTLDDSDKCFSSISKFFEDPTEKEFAKSVSHRLGKLLEKKWPLGYGDLEAAIVFDSSCPNNTLPILWAEGKGGFKWTPLFKRH